MLDNNFWMVDEIEVCYNKKGGKKNQVQDLAFIQIKLGHESWKTN